ncbi:MAG TPA: hypothetical protein VGH73_03190 [Thermoanaerobaculia bacterium]|jgi:hypothetical protein
MAWIIATTLDGRNANLNISQIAAVLDRVPGKPQDGSVVILAASGESLECKESPAELLRAIDAEDRPGDASAQPTQAW